MISYITLIHLFHSFIHSFMLFDIVIPVGPNDYERIKRSIPYTQQNIIGYRNIYLVSAIDMKIQNTIFIDESIFPFQVCLYLGKNNRNGWYFQQLIKLYASHMIPDILPQYLVIDSDTFFIQPTTFFNKEGIPFYNIGTEYNIEYFHHMNRLHPILSKKSSCSGITHHMLFKNVFWMNCLNWWKIIMKNHFMKYFSQWWMHPM